MLFSDLLADPEPVLQSLHHLRHRGNEVILFHILDEAEVHLPVRGDDRVRGRRDARDADWSTPTASRPTTSTRSPRSGPRTARSASAPGSTTSPWTPGMPFDKALMSYLLSRQARG